MLTYHSQVAQGESLDRERPTRVLVVDDNEANRLLFKAQLGRQLELIAAGTCEAGLAGFDAHAPDLVLLDVLLPDGSGLELCRALRSKPGGHRTPILIVSNAADAEDRERGFAAGATDYLGRPYDRGDLQRRIAALVRIKRLEEALDKVTISTQSAAAAPGLEHLLLALTGGKLRLLTPADRIRYREECSILHQMQLRESSDVALARSACEEALRLLRVERERVFDLALCVTEAATNAVKHAGGGWLTITRLDDAVLVFVDDNGPGIDFRSWHTFAPQRGSKPLRPRLGYGYTILLELLDNLLLDTHSRGTTIGLEMKLHLLHAQEANP